MLIVDIAFDLADQYMKTHVSILKRSGADIFVFAGAPAVAAKVITIAADLNWHPVFILDSAAASIATALKPAGLEKFRRCDLNLIPEGRKRPDLEG
jgi:branched-chain amino acid transport system substrate-binding protein